MTSPKKNKLGTFEIVLISGALTVCLLILLSIFSSRFISPENAPASPDIIVAP